jgi:ABC-type transport system substrate-binding protein
MVDTLEGGLVSVAHSWLLPSIPEYGELEHYVVRYEYDPRRAGQEVEALGSTRGPDGVFRDSGGQRLTLEVRSIALPDINARTQLVVRDDWQRLGVTVESSILPAQSIDPLLTRNFPAFLILRFPADVFAGPSALHTRQQPRGGYSHPDFDALIDRFEVTMARRERLEIAGQIVQHMTGQLTIMPLFYDPGIGFVRNKLLNVPPLADDAPWNAYEWDLR